MEYFFNEKVLNVLTSKSKSNEKSFHIIQFNVCSEEIVNILSGIALSAASRDVRVLYIRQYPMSSFPTINIHENVNINYHQLENIKFFYINEYADVVRYWSSIHHSNEFASLILVENFDTTMEQFSVDREIYFSKLSALLKNSIEFIKSKNGFCKLIVASKQANQFTSILSLYYDHLWIIEESSSPDYDNRRCLRINNVWERYSVTFYRIGDDIIFNEAIFD